MNIINPATEEVIATVEADTRETVKQKYELLKKGQQAWAAVDLDKRILSISKFYELLDTQKDERFTEKKC